MKVRKFELTRCSACKNEVRVYNSDSLATGGYRCSSCNKVNRGGIFSAAYYERQDGVVLANRNMSREELESLEIE